MALNVAIQMDPIASVDINADSTFRIALEGQSRGHKIFHYLPDGLSYSGGRVTARGWPMEVRHVKGDHFTLGEEAEIDLAEWDVVWLRQDPPFDMSYVTTTHLLDLIRDKTLVVNDPFWVRNFPEKLMVLNYPELIPPTAIARDIRALRSFREKHGEIIVKPLYGNGGAGVFFLAPDDRNFNALTEMFFESSREPVIVQKFLPKVREGDKRVILVDGSPVGAVNRVPPPDEARSNMHVGGRPEKIELSSRDIDICDRIGPKLAQTGQVFVGIDVIGGLLTEINVTSPTGIVELERFDGTNAAGLIWNAIEGRISSRT